ncbi:MAG: hypothetical protein HUJ73_03565, partial [Eubacterium sp.]|nr:hypothetical protein [Eubacterium sp.]
EAVLEEAARAGTLRLPIGRKEGSLLERCVDEENGDPAVTHYEPLTGRDFLHKNTDDAISASPDRTESEHIPGRSFPDAVQPHSSKEPGTIQSPSAEAPSPYTLLQLHLETGRTHQIRVHMAAIGHPLLGDSLYHPDVIPLFEKGVPKAGAALPHSLARQALHSWKLDFTHPITGKAMHFTADIPEDLKKFTKTAG